MNSKIISLMIVGVLALILGAEASIGGPRPGTEFDRCSARLGLCNSIDVPRITYNARTNECEKIASGGCVDDPTRFLTLEECRSVCVQESEH